MQARTAAVRDMVSVEEWQARVDLAASYRLVALFGWDDLIFTHISARVPGPEHHYLINPYGLMFDEITASSLLKVGLDGRGLDPGAAINPAGHLIHSAVLKARHAGLSPLPGRHGRRRRMRRAGPRSRVELPAGDAQSRAARLRAQRRRGL